MSPSIADTIFERLSILPLVDTHTHLVDGHLGAQGLHDVALYHMAISDLYAAGCPDGARLSEYPAWPDRTEAHARIERALPYLEHIRNTSTSWGVRIILRDLYQWDEAITPENWRALDDLIRERANDRAWHREILERAGIVASCTELARRQAGADDDLLTYALEWGFFTRCQWGEYDTALYELERCWGHQPGAASPIGEGGRAKPDRDIHNIEEVHRAVAHYVDAVRDSGVRAMATHLSTDLDLRHVTDEEMTHALTRRSSAGPAERDIYASYVNEAFLSRLEIEVPDLVFQFSYGAEPLPFETGSRLKQQSISQLAEMIGRHPRLKFMCFLASRHGNQSLCTLCRELPNLSLAGYWWHNFFPSIIRQVMEERLDMLPLNRQIGFFSDAYCAEWAYAKATIVRKQLAEVLARKISQGQYAIDEALSVARVILEQTARDLLGIGK